MASANMKEAITTAEEYIRIVDDECSEAAKSVVDFRPHPIYDPKDDCLIFYMRNELPIRKRINSLLTLYISAKDRMLVGCEVKSVSKMLKLKGSFGVLVADRKLRLGIFLAFALVPTLAESNEGDEELEPYEEDLESYKDVEIEDDMLVGACA